MRKNKISGIYKIENLITNKVYIGSSVNIDDRWSRHRGDLVKGKSCSPKLQNSYNKHGFENFEFSILEECDIDNLIEREQYYIDMYNSYNEGYNCCPLAGNSLGAKQSYETKAKISKVMKGENNPFYGKKHTTDSLIKMSESHVGQVSSFKGRTHTEESKQKMLESRKDTWEETKKKISESSKGKILSDETKRKISESGKGKIQTEETKVRISEKLNGRTYSEETIKKMSESAVGRKHTDESKKKMSKSRSGRNSNKYNPTPVYQYDLYGNFLKEWRDLYELSQNGFSSSNISRACKEAKRTAFGFKWKFKE